MEVLSDSNERRSILLTLPESDDATRFFSLLSLDFAVEHVTTTQECLKTMRERIESLSAVIVDLDLAMANDYDFLRTVYHAREYDTIPVIITSLRDPDDEELRCLEEGAVDFLIPPYSRTLTKRRIENCIRVRQGATFSEIESILRELPSNIYLKDREGKYIFATHYWHHLDTGGDPTWTIRGKTDVEIRKDRENAIKAMESDNEIIRTGKGDSYIIEINADNIREFMELIKRPIFDRDGNVSGIVALINDVTEAQMLKIELEEHARTDELTRLGNRRAYDEYLAELRESGEDLFPLVVLSADCDGLKSINDSYGHLVGDEYIRLSALSIKSSLPDRARAFRIGGDEFTAFVPCATDEDAKQIMQDTQRNAQLFYMKQGAINLSLGYAIVERLEDLNSGIDHADLIMYDNKAKRKQARQLSNY